MSLLIVGSVALDDIETSHGKAEKILGGAASFASIAAAHFTQPQLLGIVGDDFPLEHIELFKARGVDTQALEIKPGKTFYWAGRYHADFMHRDTLLTELGVFEDWSPTIPEALRAAAYILLGNIHPELQLHVLEQMPSARFVACDTMNLWIKTARRALNQVIERTDLLLINDEEARMLSGEVALPLAARAIQAQGPRVVIIKRGEHGASVHTPDGVFYVPAYPVEAIVDPTGAGDTFAGALMGYLASRDSVEFSDLCQGVVQGAVLASFAVETFSLEGLVEAQPNEVEQRAQTLARMVRW